MARPVKWARDAHSIREKATRSRTETWSRGDIERLFGIGRASAQSLMKAIGDVQTVGGTHFVDRASLLRFLDEMIAADTVEAAMQARLLKAEPPPKPRPLRVSLPTDLRSAMLPDPPTNITLEPGRLEIRAETAVAMLESLVTLATIMGNDLDRFQNAIELSRHHAVQDQEISDFITKLRLLHDPARLGFATDRQAERARALPIGGLGAVLTERTC